MKELPARPRCGEFPVATRLEALSSVDERKPEDGAVEARRCRVSSSE